MLLAALAETGCAPEQAAMVGDTEFDIAMGRAAGFATIGVAWGYHPRPRLEAAGADVIIDSFDALDAALARLGDRRHELGRRGAASGGAPRSGRRPADSRWRSTASR